MVLTPYLFIASFKANGDLKELLPGENSRQVGQNEVKPGDYANQSAGGFMCAPLLYAILIAISFNCHFNQPW